MGFPEARSREEVEAIEKPGREGRARIRRRSALGALAIAVCLLAAAEACRRAAIRNAGPSRAGPSRPPRVSVHGEKTGYGFTPGEKAAVEDFLRRNPDLRIATDEDRSAARDGDDDLRRLYGVYHPYFVRGDLNDDGTLDFVLAFVRRDARSPVRRFSIVFFEGRENSAGGLAFGPGTFVERGVSLSRGDVAIDRDAVLVTPDISGDLVRRYRWDTERSALVLVREGADEISVPEVEET